MNATRHHCLGSSHVKHKKHKKYEIFPSILMGSSGSVLVPSIWWKGVDKKLDGPGPNQKGPEVVAVRSVDGW